MHTGVEGTPPGERPVDIHDADGQLLFAGLIALPTRWLAADDANVYLTAHGEGGEQFVGRYRVDEPF